jgi:hypothetical protein
VTAGATAAGGALASTLSVVQYLGNGSHRWSRWHGGRSCRAYLCCNGGWNCDWSSCSWHNCDCEHCGCGVIGYRGE